MNTTVKVLQIFIAASATAAVIFWSFALTTVDYSHVRIGIPHTSVFTLH